MIAFYGFGGGFGHLNRIRAFIKSQKINGPYLILTNNRAALNFFSKEIIVSPPDHILFTKTQMREWISSIIVKKNITTFYIDTFPSGILGELNPELFQGVTLNLLCRRLKWKAYKNLIEQPLHYTSCFVFEYLENDHYQYLINQVEEVKIIESLLELININPLSMNGLCDHVFWIIVHTSHLEEVQVLIDHAKDLAMLERVNPEIIVLTDQLIEDDTITLLRDENPRDYYHAANRIFTAAGFNTWYELAPYRSKHIAIPFPRKFDDQFWRSKQ
ncbi:hypothetical protein [Fulvivirga sediminis]|uniref:Uncharacterized protein n=1 Tax=Fulvivirga sediminis TaxID=2803949 RepID=A0A937F9T8_9BACT|nr:hypothetical protein [Fulvivirga sediminis]MBL3657254.1 hypothetical protein [Fulvivirga sediminis]